MCNVQRLVYSNDRDWDQWEISFDANFWMTEEERKSMVEEEKLAIATRVNDEQQAAEALFGLIASAQNRASVTSTTSLPNKDDTELFFASEEVAKEIIEEDGSIHSKKQKSTFPPNRIVHEIPGRDDVAPAPKGDSNNIEAPALCNVIPIVESEDREKKEEERGIQLKNEKQSYSIVTMFEKHKKGIQTSEKGTKRNATELHSENSECVTNTTKRIKNDRKTKNTTINNNKQKNKKKDMPTNKKNNKVCLM